MGIVVLRVETAEATRQTFRVSPPGGTPRPPGRVAIVVPQLRING